MSIDDSKKANRGKAMEAVAKLQEPTLDAYIRGHQYGWGMLLFRAQVIPFGIRLSVKPAPWAALARPCRNTTALAAPLLRECQAPAGVQVMVLFDAY